MKKSEILYNKLAEMGIDAAIIFDELNIRYLSDFSFTDGFLLVSKSKCILVTDFRYFDMAKENSEKVKGKVDCNGEPLPQYITRN